MIPLENLVSKEFIRGWNTLIAGLSVNIIERILMGNHEASACNQVNKQSVTTPLGLVVFLSHSYPTCQLSNITDLISCFGSHQNHLFTPPLFILPHQRHFLGPAAMTNTGTGTGDWPIAGVQCVTLTSVCTVNTGKINNNNNN